jgi:ATP-binding cassette subfamily B protein
MFSLLKKYRFHIVIALALTMVELTVELFQPYLIGKIIDDGIVAGSMPVIWGWGAVLLTVTAVSFVCGIINTFFSAHVGQGYGYDLRESLYRKVQRFSFAVFNRLPPSTYITRMTNDVQQVVNTLFMSLRIMVRAPLVVIGNMVMAMIVNPLLGFWLVVAAPALFLFVVWIMRKTGGLFRNVQQQLDRVNAMMRENLQAIRLVRAFNREERENGRFRRQARQLSDDTQAALRWSETTMPTIMLVTNAGILAMLWFGGGQIRVGDASVGDVVAVVNYAMRTGGVLSMMSWIITSFARAKASAERIREVWQLDEGEAAVGPDRAQDGTAGATDGMIHGNGRADSNGVVVRNGRDETGAMAGSPAEAGERPGLAIGGGESRPAGCRLAFRDVTLRYPGAAAPVLSGISFEALPGERIAVLGATGSGKSSLVQLIPRLYEATSGELCIDGTPVTEWDVDELRAMIGYVPQETILFSGTVRENIAWGSPSASFADIEQAARDAQIHESILQFPEGYESTIGQRGINLSGGQKQRIAIARALVRRPKILLLDDSTSALDTRTEAALLAALDRYGCTIVMVTQKVATAMRADRILLLDEGRLIACGSHADLVDRSPLYRKIVDSQNGRGMVQHV